MKSTKQQTALAVILMLILAVFAFNNYVLVPMKADNERLAAEISQKEMQLTSQYSVIMSAQTAAEEAAALTESVNEQLALFYRGLDQEDCIEELDRFLSASKLDWQHITSSVSAVGDESGNTDGSVYALLPGGSVCRFQVSGTDSFAHVYQYITAMETNACYVNRETLSMSSNDGKSFSFSSSAAFPALPLQDIAAAEEEQPQTFYSLPAEFLDGSYGNVRILPQLIRFLTDGYRTITSRILKQ